MLSINYLSNFLGEKQTNIDNFYYNKINKFETNKNIDFVEYVNVVKKNNYNLNLMESFEVLFNKSIIDFYYDNKIYKNKCVIFTFINSILSIIDETFNLYDLTDKENIIKEFIKLIDNDLFQKDLYTKFNYTKNKRFNKADIQSALKNALHFKYCDNFHLLKEYIADYLGINIYIIKLSNNLIDFSNCEYYLKKYNNNFNKYVPNFIIINDNEIYKPILKYNASCLIYSENKDIIDNLWNYLNINEIYNNNKEILEKEVLLKEQSSKEESLEKQSSKEESLEEQPSKESNKKLKYSFEILSNLKIDIIKKICTENNISLQKKSEKTNKMINKLKNELINDLLII
jgi:hypothetical protein